MAFGQAGGDLGTYFIGYSRSPRTIEQMLENMFIGKPPGNYDRLLDFTRPVTGNLFFVPSATFLEDVTVEEPGAAVAPGPSIFQDARPHRSMSDGSLRIGSLKGQRHYE
jgi:putative iron-dependent peroxidase